MKFRVLSASPAFWLTEEEGDEALRQAGCEVRRPSRSVPLSAEDLHHELAGMDAIIAGGDDLCAEVIERAAGDRLKVISRWGVGYDAVDVRAASGCGVTVTYTPGATTPAVADLAFGLMLSVARSIPACDRLMRDGGWGEVQGVTVCDKCLGIIGLGSIGQAVARRAQGFGMRVLAYDVAPDETAADELGVELVPLDALLEAADFVSLHAALTESSRGMIGEAELRRMKPSAFLINTSRGALVDEEALLRALEQGVIAGAGLDAYASEPLPADHALRRAPNTVLTPHTAFNTVETCRAVTALVVENTLAALEGREPPHVVPGP